MPTSRLELSAGRYETLLPPTPPQTHPLENLGPPILARVGIRVDWPAHRN